MCWTLVPLASTLPSFSKSQSTETMSLSSSLAVALKLTACPTLPTLGEKSKSAVGAAARTSWLPTRMRPATATGTSAFAVAKWMCARERDEMAARLLSMEGMAACALPHT